MLSYRGMKLGLTIWNNRISPVYDSAESILVVEVKETGTEHRQVVHIPLSDVSGKAGLLEGYGIQTLICGAISAAARDELVANGIEVYSFITGEIETILEAWKLNRLRETCYAMPGCRCGQRACRRRNRRGCSSNQYSAEPNL